MRNKSRLLLPIWLALACLMADSGWPQFASTPDAEPEMRSHGTERRRRGLRWWERRTPAKTDPAAQLEYANQLLEQGALRSAARHYRILTYAWPNAAEAPIAQFQYAEILHQRRKYTRAFDEYQYLIDTYAGFFPYDQVLERQHAIADTVATRVKRILFVPYQDEAEAIPLFEQLIANAPRAERAAELQFRLGRIHEDQKDYDAAIDAYAVFQQRYPRAPQAGEALFRHARCWYLYSQRYPNDARLRENALSAQQLYLNLRPGGAWAAPVRDYLAQLLQEQSGLLYHQARLYDRMSGFTRVQEEKQKLQQAAVICYRRVIREFPESEWARSAGNRLERLERRRQPIATEGSN